MKLITEVAIPEYPLKMDHHKPIVLMGSCFAENVGSLMEKYLFHVSVNPFGVTYNPLSVKTGLEALLKKDRYTKNDLGHYNDLWFSFDHYTLFSSADPKTALQKINNKFISAKERLGNASFLIITWGTAWVYRNKADGKVVSNCHKIPAARFNRSRLSVTDIVEAYEAILSDLFERNSSLKVLVNISPVRHWKDGAHGNQLSKSTLLLAQDTLQKLYPENLFYFPSYEIVMDELRDYRFFGRDMVHPTDQTTLYIWEKFEQALVSEESQKIMGELEPLLKMMDHRPLSEESKATRQLLERKDQILKDLKVKYPFLAWEKIL